MPTLRLFILDLLNPTLQCEEEGRKELERRMREDNQYVVADWEGADSPSWSIDSSREGSPGKQKEPRSCDSYAATQPGDPIEEDELCNLEYSPSITITPSSMPAEPQGEDLNTLAHREFDQF